MQLSANSGRRLNTLMKLYVSFARAPFKNIKVITPGVGHFFFLNKVKIRNLKLFCLGGTMFQISEQDSCLWQYWIYRICAAVG